MTRLGRAAVLLGVVAIGWGLLPDEAEACRFRNGSYVVYSRPICCSPPPIYYSPSPRYYCPPPIYHAPLYILPQPHLDAPKPAASRTARVLLVGDTDDKGIGESVKTDLKELEKLLRNQLPKAKVDIHVLSGRDCEPKRILSKVRELGKLTQPQDTFFCYYSGHGAYDPRLVNEGPSKGHYFGITLDNELQVLKRRTLMDSITAQPGRLKVLITDVCNSKLEIPPASVVTETMSLTVTTPVPLEELLLYHSGVVDVNSAKQGQMAVGLPGPGGAFTFALRNNLSRTRDWTSLLKTVGTEANGVYQQVRTEELKRTDLEPDVRKAWEEQREMNPVAFQLKVSKDPIPVQGNTVQMNPPVMRVLFIKKDVE